VHSLILRCCNISDRGLEALMEFLQALYKLEIAGCNEITEQVPVFTILRIVVRFCHKYV
jgi:hypothetical protein